MTARPAHHRYAPTLRCETCSSVICWETFGGLRLYTDIPGDPRPRYRTRCACGSVERTEAGGRFIAAKPHGLGLGSASWRDTLLVLSWGDGKVPDLALRRLRIDLPTNEWRSVQQRSAYERGTRQALEGLARFDYVTQQSGLWRITTTGALAVKGR